jgi:peptidoglycan/LPS O-acetylase OafA/YrhL
MRPLLVLILVPMLIGIVCEMVFRNARKASWVAMLGAALAVLLGLQAGDPTGAWNWLAALLVMPLPVAVALLAVMLYDGRSQVRRRHRRT